MPVMEEQHETDSARGSIPRIFSLSEVSAMIRDLFQQAFPVAVWVKAEIARMTIHQQSGHCYLDLVEKQLTQTRAQFRAVMWASDYDYISEKFAEVTREVLKSGMYVLILSRPVFHPVYGLSLQITDIEPSFTLGEMERQKLATISQLKGESIFNRNKLLTFPSIPLRLAVISAETSKGYSDFLNIIGHYPRQYRFQISLFTALLQGDRAVDSIVTQLRNIEARSGDFDLVLIIRGGGDEIGMTCFDNYTLSREVCLHPLPVVTGIGHSTNETVVELVAGRNKITPTDVAYDILGLLDVAASSLAESKDVMLELVNGFLLIRNEKLETRAKHVSGLLHGRISQENIRLEQRSEWLLTLFAGVIRNSQARLTLAVEILRRRPRKLMQEKTAGLAGLERQVVLLDPVNVLKRGFSLTFRADRSLLKSAGDAVPGDVIVTRMHDGTLMSRVETGDA
jgi:exodeoxyribonuclease VII large subunit